MTYFNSNFVFFEKIMLGRPSFGQKSPLVIVDSSISGKMSTMTSNSTITGEIHTKIDNGSAKSVHYNEKLHYYEIHYDKRQLYYRYGILAIIRRS